MENVIKELDEVVERLSYLYKNFPPLTVIGEARDQHGLVNEAVVLRKVARLLADCKAACEKAKEVKRINFVDKYGIKRKDAAAYEKIEGDVYAQEEALLGLNYFPVYGGMYWINRDAKFSEEDQRTCDQLYAQYCEDYKNN